MARLRVVFRYDWRNQLEPGRDAIIKAPRQAPTNAYDELQEFDEEE
jgi:hypothetical protein